MKRFADPQPAPKVIDNAVIDPPDYLAWVILDIRQGLGKGSRAGSVAAGGGGHAKRLVGPLKVINAAPLIKASLARFKVVEERTAKNLGLKCAMETFVLALGLRVVWPRMAHSDTQQDQPRGQRCVGMFRVRSPRGAVVHGHPFRQAVAPEGLCEAAPDRLPALVGAGPKNQCETRMVVQSRKGVASSEPHREMPLEVHLPQAVGRGVLEPPPRRVFGRFGWIKPMITAEYLRHRAGAGESFMTHIFQPPLDLAGSPGGMLVPHRQRKALDFRRNPLGRGKRSPRDIHQARLPFLAVAAEPFVGRLAADFKTLAKLANVGVFMRGQNDKFLA